MVHSSKNTKGGHRKIILKVEKQSLNTSYDSLFTELAPEVLERTEAVPR